MNNSLQRDWDEANRFYRIHPDVSDAQFAELSKVYNGQTRFYHNWEHLSYMFVALKAFKDARQISQEEYHQLAFAIFFHDYVYDTGSKTNEIDSAAVATGYLNSAGLGEVATVVAKLIIEGTTHPAPVSDNKLVNIIHDLDLCNFFGCYESVLDDLRRVRKEYSFVPEAVFREKRAEILTTFAAGRVYNTDLFHSNYEAKAKENLIREATDLIDPNFKLEM